MRVLPVLVILEQADLLEQRGAGQLCLIYDEHGAPSVTVHLARRGAWRLDHETTRAAPSNATIAGATSVSAATRSAPARCKAASGMP